MITEDPIEPFNSFTELHVKGFFVTVWFIYQDSSTKNSLHFKKGYSVPYSYPSVKCQCSVAALLFLGDGDTSAA